MFYGSAHHIDHEESELQHHLELLDKLVNVTVRAPVDVACFNGSAHDFQFFLFKILSLISKVFGYVIKYIQKTLSKNQCLFVVYIFKLHCPVSTIRLTGALLTFLELLRTVALGENLSFCFVCIFAGLAVRFVLACDGDGRCKD